MPLPRLPLLALVLALALALPAAPAAARSRKGVVIAVQKLAHLFQPRRAKIQARATVATKPVLAPKPAVTSKLPPTPRALLPDGTAVAPSNWGGGYHGTSTIAPEVALRDGLPARGGDWRLREHTEAGSQSAFRGVTETPSEPISGNGAAYWAGEGGWVYEIRGVPGWDVNVLLEGRVSVAGAFYRGNLMSGESEIAIPARVAPENIRAYGKVVEDAAGHLIVRQWIQNPGYRGPAPRRRRRRSGTTTRRRPRAPTLSGEEALAS